MVCSLGIGAYRCDDLKPYLFPSVARAEEAKLRTSDREHEYAPIAGLPAFRAAAARLIFGDALCETLSGRVFSMQSIGGTGAVRVAFELCRKVLPAGTTLYLPSPTWGNHPSLASNSGFTADMMKTYNVFDPETKGLPPRKELLQSFQDMPEGSLVLLQACAHNPTGVDPSMEDWEAILTILKSRGIFPIFDIAYQGFASGSLDRDASAIRLAASMGMEMFVCQSFSKIMGLYGQRVGCLHLLAGSEAESLALLSHAEIIVRRSYSNPPRHGAEIATAILSDATGGLSSSWEKELHEVYTRISSMRHILVKELEAAGAPGDWSHIQRQVGMFSFTGLPPWAVDRLVSDHHVYLLKNGRISISGLNASGCKYFAQCIAKVLLEGPTKASVSSAL